MIPVTCLPKILGKFVSSKHLWFVGVEGLKKKDVCFLLISPNKSNPLKQNV
jgi:hypothetical protein